MRRINVVKPFNFLHPDGTRHAFGVGVHEVGTYRKPVWDRAKDAPVDDAFTEHEIGDHPYVRSHCGKMPTAQELLAEADRMRAQAEAMTKQAEDQAAAAKAAGAYASLAPGGAEPAAAPAIEAAVKPNTQTKGAAVKPNTKQ